MNIAHSTSYTNEVFSGLDAKNVTVQQSVFDDCRFVDCDFSYARFTDCRFRDCEFENSSLNSINVDGAKVIGATFRHTKATGINWTTLDWSSYRLGPPIVFQYCDISFSVFRDFSLESDGTTKIINICHKRMSKFPLFRQLLKDVLEDSCVSKIIVNDILEKHLIKKECNQML